MFQTELFHGRLRGMCACRHACLSFARIWRAWPKLFWPDVHKDIWPKTSSLGWFFVPGQRPHDFGKIAEHYSWEKIVSKKTFFISTLLCRRATLIELCRSVCCWSPQICKRKKQYGKSRTRDPPSRGPQDQRTIATRRLPFQSRIGLRLFFQVRVLAEDMGARLKAPSRLKMFKRDW